MEELNQLKLKAKLLEIELQSIRSKITLIESFNKTITVTDVPEEETLETEAIPEQTATGKGSSNPLKAVALPKSKTKVNCEPIPLGKSQSSPEQTAPGKDSTNPLIPVALGKSKKTFGSTSSSFPELRPSYLTAAQEPAKNSERFYVIYNGPHAGIYTNWGIVGEAVRGKPYEHKKFRTLHEAQLSADKYCQTFGGNIKVRNVQSPVIAQTKEVKFRPTARIQEKPAVEEDIFQGTNFEDFQRLWYQARKIRPEDLLSLKVFTDDKKTRSYFNFLAGAAPEMVFSTFQAGLVRNIYPSSNLQELKFFPAGFKKAVKSFRTKIAKAEDSPLYINITSSIPDWYMGNTFAPYYYVEIGLAKSNKEIEASKIMEDDISNDFSKFRLDTLELVIKKSLHNNCESKVKVNYCNHHCIITSWCAVTITEEDSWKLCSFEETFQRNALQVAPTTMEKFCKRAQKLFEDHACDACDKKDPTEDAMSTSTLGDSC